MEGNMAGCRPTCPAASAAWLYGRLPRHGTRDAHARSTAMYTTSYVLMSFWKAPLRFMYWRYLRSLSTRAAPLLLPGTCLPWAQPQRTQRAGAPRQRGQHQLRRTATSSVRTLVLSKPPKPMSAAIASSSDISEPSPSDSAASAAAAAGGTGGAVSVRRPSAAGGRKPGPRQRATCATGAGRSSCVCAVPAAAGGGAGDGDRERL